MKKAFPRKYFWTILASLTAFILSVIPIPEMPDMPNVPLMDKWVHFVMYGGVACAMWFDAYRSTDDRRIRFAVALRTLVWPIFLGGALELWQHYLTTCRSGEWLDLYADALGALIALPIGLWLIRPYARSVSRWMSRK